MFKFLLQKQRRGPKIVRIFGESGSGKSFFAKELLVQLSASYENGVGVYLDFPPADLGAAGIFSNIDTVLSSIHLSNRVDPAFVPRDMSRRWRTYKEQRSDWRRSYGYGVVRDLSGQIPIIGPFIRAILPASLSFKANSKEPELDSLRFLIRQSHDLPVVIALDNIQFIPFLLREILEREFELFGTHMVLIIIERFNEKISLNWFPLPKKFKMHDIHLDYASLDEVKKIVEIVLPHREDISSISETIHRRSEGNLKSIWFQIKFISHRNKEQNILMSAASYESVIQSLHPSEQFILKIIVILLGGITVGQMLQLCKMLNIGIDSPSVTNAIGDLSALGLIIKSNDTPSKVQVEHELISKIVRSITPEEEKIELRQQIVAAIVRVIQTTKYDLSDDVLYDRLLGIASDIDVRSSPSLQIHISNYLQAQYDSEKFSYLASLLRDSVCWEVVDILPAHITESLFIALQRCSLFSFGIVAAENLKRYGMLRELAQIFEAKYLVQLFLYDKAEKIIADLPPSKDLELIRFTILLNKCENVAAADISTNVFNNLKRYNPSEPELVILRNSAHLFDRSTSQNLLNTALKGFKRIGSRFGVATVLNNSAIIYICYHDYNLGQKKLRAAQEIMSEISSPEIYQSIINMSAIHFMREEYTIALSLITEARKYAPSSLAMDGAMLDANESVINFKLGYVRIEEMLKRFEKIYKSAARTKDARFIETVFWFLHQLEIVVIGQTEIEFSSEMINEILDNTNPGMEIFVSCLVDDFTIQVPYFLSPHWRH